MSRHSHCTAEQFLDKSDLIERGPPDVYRLPLVLTHSDKDYGLYRYSVGDPPGADSLASERVLLLVGATGSGKSTVVDAVANYAFGVKFSDGFRFKVVTGDLQASQAHSLTRNVTAYTFHSTALNYVLTVVDTPGFGNVSGVETDMQSVNQIQRYFFAGRDKAGIDFLHGVGFVLQSSVARLTPSQRNVMDAVLSLFGKDVAGSIVLFATFADANTPSVLNVVNAACIPFKHCFKFNNSALFARSDSEWSSFNSVYWEMSMKSFESFSVHFLGAERKSLSQSREILNEREKLHAMLSALQIQAKVGFNHMCALQEPVLQGEVRQQKIQQLQELQREMRSLVTLVQKNYERLGNFALRPGRPVNGFYEVTLAVGSEEFFKLRIGGEEWMRHFKSLLEKVQAMSKESCF